MNNTDDDSIDLKNLNQSALNKTNLEVSYFEYREKIEVNFILIELKSNNYNNITLITNFNKLNNMTQIFDLYSYQLFYLKKKEKIFFHINKNKKNENRVTINNIGGNGYFSFYDNYQLEGKNTYSFSLSNKIPFENITFQSKTNLIFYIKITQQIKYNFMNELNYHINKKDIIKKDKNPIIFFIKDIKYNGIDVNINFRFNKNSYNKNNFIIKGGAIEFNKLKEIENENDVINKIEFPINGIYDPIINNGLIAFDKEFNKEKSQNKKKKKINRIDKYFFIIIENNNKNKKNKYNFEINVIPKNDNQTFLMINKYIQSSFKLTNKPLYQKYFLDKEMIKGRKFYIELSSNYENTDLIFNAKIKYKMKIIGGVKRYHLLISSEESQIYFFTIQVKKKEKSNTSFIVTTNLIYYLEKEKINIEDVVNKVPKLDYDKEKKLFNLLIESNKEKSDNDNNNYNFTYYYYLRYIKKDDIIKNEKINTISPINSKMTYLEEYKTKDINEILSYNSIKLGINQKYMISLFIKIVDEKRALEKYYSTSFELETKLPFYLEYKITIIILSFSFFIIIVLIIFFFCWKKIRNKNKNLEEKVNSISFTSEKEDDFLNDNILEKSKIDDEYENIFI